MIAISYRRGFDFLIYGGFLDSKRTLPQLQKKGNSTPKDGEFNSKRRGGKLSSSVSLSLERCLLVTGWDQGAEEGGL